MPTPLTPIPARVADLRGDVSPVAPTNRQAFVWVASTGKWTPSALVQSDVANLPTDLAAKVSLTAHETITGRKSHRNTQTAAPATFGADAALRIEQDRGGVAVGNMAVSVFVTNFVAVPHLYLQAGIRDSGAFVTGAYFLATQKHTNDGDFVTVAVGAMGAFSADGNFPAGAFENNLVTHGANASALAVFDLNDPDTARWPPGDFHPGSGKKKMVVQPTGDIIHGPDLNEDAETNRYSKFHLDTTVTPPVMRHTGSSAVSPFNGQIYLQCVPLLVNNVGLSTYLADGTTVAALLYQDSGNSIHVGNGSAGGLYFQVSASGFCQITDNAGNPGFYLQFPGKATVLYGTLAIGNGAAIKKTLMAAGALDFPSIAAGAQAALTMAVAGAEVNATVLLGPPPALNAGLSAFGFVSAADVVTIRVTNNTAGAIDPVNATWRVQVNNF